MTITNKIISYLTESGHRWYKRIPENIQIEFEKYFDKNDVYKIDITPNFQKFIVYVKNDKDLSKSEIKNIEKNKFVYDFQIDKKKNKIITLQKIDANFDDL